MSCFWFRHSSRGTPRASQPRRRAIKINLPCESLELRQLLSVGASSSTIDQITVQPAVQVAPLVTTGPSGDSPQQIQDAYGVNQITFSNGSVSGNGAGQTIAIIDAYNDPNIASDLAKFDAEYGLPAPPSFTVDNLGATSTNAGWALEESLDVEWAHALAPKANIILVQAPNDSLNSLFNAVSTASHIPSVSVVSMSWGTEEFFGEWNYDSIFTTPQGHIPISYLASSGDTGAWYGPMYPSVSPNVVAVGGTTLTVGAGDSYGSESGWSDSTGGFSGTDNGFYFGELAPSYQVAAQAASGINYGVRTTPDVSFNANPETGVAVYDSVAYDGQSGWFEVGGTSAAAPSWAGIVAITDQGLTAAGKSTLSSTQLLTQLYDLPSSDYHQITSGSNGYQATAGYNLVTGLGSPKANLLVAGLLSANGVSSSSSSVNSTVVTTVTSHSHSTGGGHRFVSVTSSSGASSNQSVVSTSNAITSTNISAQYAALPATSSVSPPTTGSSGQSESGVSAGSSASTAGSGATLGQGLQPLGSLVVVLGNTSEDAPGASIIDTVDSGEAPAPANAAPQPAADPKADPAPEPLLPVELRDSVFDLTLPYIDAAINQWKEGDSTAKPKEPPAGRADDAAEDSESEHRAALSGVSIVLGTAAVLAGGNAVARCRSGWRRRLLSQRCEAMR